MNMKRIRILALAIVVAASCALPALAAIELEQNDQGAVIRTPAYAATISTTGGAALTGLTDLVAGRELRITRAGLTITAERDRPEWSDAWTPAPVIHDEAKAAADTRFESRGAGVACVSQWSCPVAEVEKTMLFTDDSPAIEIAWHVRVTSPVEEITYWLQTSDAGLFREARVYPGDERMVSRGGHSARYRAAPALVYCHDGKTGLGLAASRERDGIRAVASAIMPGPNAVQLAAYSEVLRWRETPFEFDMRVRVPVGSNPEETLAWHRATTPDLEPLAITKLAVDKLIHRSTEAGHAWVTLTNNSDGPRQARLTARIEGGVDQSRDLPEQAVDLAAGETTRLPIEWENQGQHGFSLAASLLDADGQELDSAREHFAVADNFSRVGQMAVFNPGWMSKEWLIPSQIELAKDNYVGTIEYYCWAPDQVFDLTPDTEEFEPHTESQGSYRTQLTRSFVQDLVRQAHDSGLRVVAMDTGWASLKGALDHPDWMKYTRDGQIYLYNGNMHDGKRFNAVGAHVFTPERSRQWAREMAASVDMFGWDGVRFDWNFIPISPGDPLYLDSGKPEEADEHEWFDSEGRSALDLFPDPDATAAQLCRAWRETVAEQHPDFVYHANYQVDDEIAARFPQYTQAVGTDSGILREGLLDVARRYPTWQEWTAALMDTTRILRPLGGQPSVGWMRGYAPGSVSQRTLQNCMIASGFHWYGSAQSPGSIDDTHRRFAHALRFSEYFYDPGFLPVDDPAATVEVAGEGSERVLWQPFVFEREAGETRETLAHLINLPESDHIIQRHELPPARTDLTVAVSLAPGAEVTACWMISPDPEPRAVEIPWEADAAGRAVCRVPDLRSIVSIVLVTDAPPMER